LTSIVLAVSELRVAFRQQLQAIEGKVIKLFAFVSEDLAIATEALLSGDATALQVISERDAIIDSLQQEMEHLVDNELVLQSPMASDLRLVLSTMRIVPELERSHDLVEHISEHATHFLSDELSPRTRGLIHRMGDVAGEMWNQTANAWYQRDSDAAVALDERDDDLDSLHLALMAELASGKMSIPVVMDMTLVARFYERLGDHAVNIARRVAYLAGEGTDTKGVPNPT
jgi:phosphate transport system protein